MEVRRSSFIVVGSSIKVPTKFASQYCRPFPPFCSLSLSLSLDSSFSRRGRESFRIHHDKPVRFSPSFSLASSPFHLHRTTFFLSFLNFSVIAYFYPSPRIPNLFFSFRLCASAIITGKLTAQIFNLVWQMADLEARGTFARRDKRARRSFHICPQL